MMPCWQEAALANKHIDLEGKVAVVIGGTTGIGHAIALGFAQAGATVVASSRREDRVQAVAKELEALGSKTLAVTSDVQDRDSLENLRDQVVKKFGRVDIAMVTAGVLEKAPSEEV